MSLTKAEKDLLREIDRNPGAHVMVTMPETEAAGERLVKLGLAGRVSPSVFVSVKHG